MSVRLPGPEMTKAKCIATLEFASVTQDMITQTAPYLDIERSRLCLDGDFTPNEIRAIVWWLDNPQEFEP